MSSVAFTKFIQPDQVPRFTKEMARQDMFNYPPNPVFDRLLGVWGPLSKEPFKGITTDGTVESGCFERQPDGAPVEATAQAATRWLHSLSPEMRHRVQHDLESDLWRHWQNTPLILQESQLELLDQSQEQRELAQHVVRTSLSETGFWRTQRIVANNVFLGQINGLTDLMNEFCFTLNIFGTPSTSSPWGWQLFGHHLCLNCMFVDGQMVLSPVFMGIEPDLEVGPEKRQLFKPHEDAALATFHALSNDQQQQAILYDSMLTADQPEGRFHPDDGRQVGGAFQDNRVVPLEGVCGADLDRKQRQALLALSEQFICNMPSGPAEARMNEIERYLDRTHFAWIGKANDVDPFYCRIHSPVALIEFDHHSGIFLANEEPERFHVHTIVRTPNGNDYGKDLLRQHYAQGGHDHGASGTHSHDGGKTFHSHD